MNTTQTPLMLLDEAIALAQLELEELQDDSEDALTRADEYASKRYAIVNHACKIQKKDETYPIFKEKLEVLYGLQKTLLSVAEGIRTNLLDAIHVAKHSQKVLGKYKSAVQTDHLRTGVTNSIG